MPLAYPRDIDIAAVGEHKHITSVLRGETLSFFQRLLIETPRNLRDTSIQVTCLLRRLPRVIRAQSKLKRGRIYMRLSDIAGRNGPTGFFFLSFPFFASFLFLFLSPPFLLLPPLALSLSLSLFLPPRDFDRVHFYGWPKAKPTGLNS